MLLLIAEKPSVARTLAEAVGATEKHEGYLQGGCYIVSWCVGHLVELALPEAYDPKYLRWRYADLPILPKEWLYNVSESTRAQFEVLKRLMHHENVQEVICATDAGREGELIFRLVYEKAGCTLPIRRLWISSMEESAIREGLTNMKTGDQYESLYQAALCRARADWLIGMNATRLFSLLYGPTLHVGRVMTPTMAMITDREKKVKDFIPETFYTVKLALPGFTAQSERFQNHESAVQVAGICDKSVGIVTKIEQKRHSENPPKLYDLTTLQRDANRIFGFTAQQTLEYAQTLYEKKLLTYPRTDSQYLTHDMEAGISDLSSRVASQLPFASALQLPCNSAVVVNDNKVSDHHAILPTKTMPSQADVISSLLTGERDLLHLVCTRMLCALGDPYQYDETMITIRCGEHDFIAKGKKIVQMGWQAVWHTFRGSIGSRLAEDEENSPAIPEWVKEGQDFPYPKATVSEGKTTAPARFTEGSLLHAMETASADEMPDDAERKGIGTPATRASILEKLIENGLIERQGDRKKKVLVPTAKGIALSSVLPPDLLSAKLTADWENRLKKIEHGEEDPAQFMKDIEEMITGLTRNVRRSDNAETLFPPLRPKLAACPKCGAAVTEREQGFMCENRTCGFALWKNHGFLKNSGKQLTKEDACKLMTGETIHMTGLRSPKTKTAYNAAISMAYDENGKPVLRPTFER